MSSRRIALGLAALAALSIACRQPRPGVAVDGGAGIDAPAVVDLIAGAGGDGGPAAVPDRPVDAAPAMDHRAEAGVDARDQGGAEAGVDARDQRAEAGVDAADAGALECGARTCAPDQYCVTIHGGAPPQCVPRADGGACPPGTRLGCSLPQTGFPCEVVREPLPRCEAISPACAEQEPCRCLCRLAPGPGGGCVASGRSVACYYP